MTQQAHTRPPAVAGTFYQGDPERLAGEIAAMLSESRPGLHPAPIRPKALIVPHAWPHLLGADRGPRLFTGNVHDRSGGTTHCPGCGRPVIERDWYDTYALDDTGHCEHCGAAMAGRFGRFGRPFGSRRIPVSLHAR